MTELDGHDTPGHQDPHKPADDREEVYFSGSPMLRAEALKVLGFGLLGVVIAAAPFAIMAMSGPSNLWATIACIVIGLMMILIPVMMQKTVRYRISNYRID